MGHRTSDRRRARLVWTALPSDDKARPAQGGARRSALNLGPALLAVLLLATFRPAAAATILLETGEYRDVLRDNLTEDGRINFAEAVRRRESLNRYLSKISKVEEDILRQRPPEDRKAFWIAVYHGLLLATLLDRYEAGDTPPDARWPGETGRSLTADREFWTKISVTAAGKRRTLRSVEEILWAEYPDPRWPFVLSRGAVSGPSMPLELPGGKGLDKFMERRTKEFFADKRNLFRAVREKRLYLNPLILWYKEKVMSSLEPEVPMVQNYRPEGTKDTHESRRVISAILPYLARTDRTALESDGWEVEYSYFDWRLPDSASETEVKRPLYIPGQKPLLPEKPGTGISDTPDQGRGSDSP